MKGMGVLFALLGLSAFCAALAGYGHFAGWPVWGLVILWLLSLPAASALVGSVLSLFNSRR